MMCGFISVYLLSVYLQAAKAVNSHNGVKEFL